MNYMSSFLRNYRLHRSGPGGRFLQTTPGSPADGYDTKDMYIPGGRALL